MKSMKFCWMRSPGRDVQTKSLFDALWFKKSEQIDLALLILTTMQHNAIEPTKKVYQICLKVFGYASEPHQKCISLYWWLRAFQGRNPYKLANPNLSHSELAIHALRRMIGVPDGSIYSLHQEGDPFIYCSLFRSAAESISRFTAEKEGKSTAYVCGPYRIWLGSKWLYYYSFVIDHSTISLCIVDDSLDSCPPLIENSSPQAAASNITPPSDSDQHNSHLIAKETLRPKLDLWVSHLNGLHPELTQFDVMYILS
eukprot:Sdes_comp8977_c0_seq1m394